jgi:hypothetical protein
MAQRYLTHDAGDSTHISSSASGIRVSAPPLNLGSNSRSVLYRTDATASLDQVSCLSATHSGLPVQEGVALRIDDSSATTRAVTVTKNIWFGYHTLYNVHGWDTSRAVPLQPLGYVDLVEVLGGSSAPRRLCARVRGDLLELKAWPADRPEPAWEDHSAVHRLSLPPEWVFEGRPGWYIGHVPPDGWAMLTDLVADTLSIPTEPPSSSGPSTSSTTTSTTTTTVDPDAGASTTSTSPPDI